MPIEKRTLASTRQLEDVIEEFFALRLGPRRIPKIVRLDATWYEVEFIGDDTLSFASDDHETPMVKWVEALLTALEARFLTIALVGENRRFHQRNRDCSRIAHS